MRNLLRQPLTWMVLGELAVVASLAIVAWHVVAAVPANDPPVLLAPSTSSPSDAAALDPTNVIPEPSPGGLQLPGLNVDPGFWRFRLAELNTAQAEFEALEWKIVHSAMDTVRRYLESVVLPSLSQAERGR
jgi:hypothetical protein